MPSAERKIPQDFLYHKEAPAKNKTSTPLNVIYPFAFTLPA
jgi:hypothetical protein